MILIAVTTLMPRLSRLVLAFGAYFGLGAYYNYSTYGATGLDLIPYVSPSVPCSATRLTPNTQTSRFLERSPVHAARRRFTSMLGRSTKTHIKQRRLYRCMMCLHLRQREMDTLVLYS